MKFLAPTRRNLLGKRRSGERRKLRLEVLEARLVRASLPFGAMPNDTGEFMLGRVAVTPILLESNGQVDTSTENWNKAHIDEVLANLNQGLDWWDQMLATKTTVHSLEFVVDRSYADQPVPTAYEPINRVSNDFALWTQEFLMRAGFNKSPSLEENMRAFNDSQRQKLNADWSFTIFVANSQQEGDGTFSPGGSFSRAFAFAGGLFFVTPSTRPASTYAHETGHMFWARDEYAGGGSYYLQRGYYATQNTNAVDNNPDVNFQQAPSIMSSGELLDTAYTDLVSPATTLAMVGWQDSDGDGIFDVLDVPLLLDGVGRIDVTTGNYRFVGKANVQTLPNRNPSGLGNDITLNKVSRIEARLGSGQWQTILQPNAYEASLDLSIPVTGQSGGTLQLRAVDAATGITSNVFEGEIGALPDATPLVGINGFVWNDANANGLFDAIESGLGTQQVRLVDQAGKPPSLQRAIEPDTQVPGLIASTAYSGVLLTAIGADTNGNLAVANDAAATTGSKVFRPYSVAQSGFTTSWNHRRQLKIEFALPTSFVSVDIIGTARSYGRLELYSSDGKLLDRVTTAQLSAGQSQKLELGRPTPDIAYAIVRGHMGTDIGVDNILYGPKTQTTTDSTGRYAFTNLPAGNYQVQVLLASGVSQVTSPSGGKQVVAWQPGQPAASQGIEHVDFGINYQNTSWHNARLPADVNDDGHVTAIDALLVINLLNQGIASELTGSNIPFPPYIDVSNDAFITPLDALLVINTINSGGSGESEARGEVASAPDWPTGGLQDAQPTRAEAELAMAPGVDRKEEVARQRPAADAMASQANAIEGESASADRLFGQLGLGHQSPESPALLSDRATSIDAVMSDAELIASLNANPWTLPEPCTCAECVIQSIS